MVCAMFLNTFRMFLWLFFLGNVISAPADEFLGIIHDGELALNDEKYVKYIVPANYNQQKIQKPYDVDLKDLISEDNENYQILQKHIASGHAMKGLTFNIYDDNMRETAIAFFKLLKVAKEDNLPLIRKWALKNINKDIVDYAYRLILIYRDFEVWTNKPENKPPFLTKPNFFVNGETITKALKLKINNGKFDENEGFVNQCYRDDNIVTINANYSGWNFWNSECEYRLDYFREDIAMNSYYYGIHLKYPFWMSNDELSEIDSLYAERYYFIHKQLVARYNLEKEHLKYTTKSTLTKCYDNFNPSLMYDNGLPFPIRSNTMEGWNENQSRLKSIDIAIKECISRGFIYMDNGTKVTLTEDNYIDLLAKLIRANYEGTRTSKIVKSLYGYGASGYPTDRYNPAPSVLHHPETTLRDPIYWYLIESLLKYFSDYSKTLEPYDLSKYETNEFEIVDTDIPKIITYYDYYRFNLNEVFGDNSAESLVFAARQKRLKHLHFTVNFTVNSIVNKIGTVKIFLGPQCNNVSCWDQYSSFFEIESFERYFDEGINEISWSPEDSETFSFDDYYSIDSKIMKNNIRFNLFKFPENMLIPKGYDQGLNFTLFVMIIPQKGLVSNNILLPFGFPFHRQALISENSSFGNYKFFNISIFHKENNLENNGKFSPHLN